MIEDDELRSIFIIESAEHIQRLEQGLLEIEKDPGNRIVLDDIFRAVHSLKGASHMLGLNNLESMSHSIEDTLSAAREGSAPLSPDTIDYLYVRLDALIVLVKESVRHEDSCGVSYKAIEDSHCSDRYKKNTIQETSEADVKNPALTGKATQKEAPGKFRIDTIRVETKRLDKMMSQSGELNVTKHRIARRLDDANEILVMWENIYKKPRVSAVENSPQIEKFGALLSTLQNGLYNESSRLDYIASALEDSISSIRLLPVSTIFNFFQRMVRDLAKEKMKDVRLVIEGGDTAVDKLIIEEVKDPLMHMLRNAVDHGIEMPDERIKKNKPHFGTIILKAYHTASDVVIEVSDDGRGLDTDAIKKAALKMKIINESELNMMPLSSANSLIFASGVSTSAFVSDISGRGVGLDVAKINIERLKGSIQIESLPDTGCTVRIRLPLTLAASKVMIVSADAVKYAISVEHILAVCLIKQENIFTLQGRRAISYNEIPVHIADLSELLDSGEVIPFVKDSTTNAETISCVIISIGENKLGLLVDELVDEQEVVLKQNSGILKRVRNITGSIIIGTGEICLLLNPYDLLKTAEKLKSRTARKNTTEEPESVKSILIAEDSITLRVQMKRILEGAGYKVKVAVDGLEAYNMISEFFFDGVVSDIQMPNMTGLELTEKIRQNKKYSEVPVILITSLSSDADRKRGIEAGANAYITKPSFDQKILIDTLRRLI